MKRIRELVLVTLIIYLFAVAPISASAHAGKTDSDGGHWDNETGEYHYHHGYPAHSHYDRNGDGIVDCPYDFDDQTGANSGGASDSKSYSYSNNSYNNTSYKDNVVVKTETVTKTVTEEVPYIPAWVYWTIGILSVLCLTKIVQVRWRNDEIEQLRDQYRSAEEKHKKDLASIEVTYASRIDQVRSSFVKTIQDRDSEIAYYAESLDKLQEEHQLIKTKYQLLLSSTGQKPGGSSISQVIDGVEIPKGIYFINGNVPVKGKISDRKPFGDYTVYVAERGKCFHTDYYCGSGLYRAKHIYDVIDKKAPCQKCAYSCSTDVPDWYKQLKSIRK